MVLKILLLILLIPIIILSIVLIIHILPFPPPIDGIRDQISAIAAGIFSLIYLTWIFFYTIYSFRRAGRILDDICLASGLVGTSLGFFGRKYYGIKSNRQIMIEYFPPRTIQRALLNIYVECLIGKGFIISRQNPISGGIKYKSYEYSAIWKLPGEYKIYSGDDKKTYACMSVQGFRKTLELILSAGDDNKSLKQIYLQDDRIWLRERLSRISGETIKDYIKNLLILAHETENQ
ncbi:MAG: hypothetical protein MUO59_03615 [Actinobacteria bacterium]|nr:hypothetical protein [Actinomycetota bacterium]